ncbi:MAG: AbrB/MazE/SpoVT family DNA-binding domain-containing protein [Candidatus Thermoplasmatota archaeon]|jgi:AbrB family looped-hinge helix DNA binding protein|nr:AbrB/MazE/SpoVT family DNA-binding domain-containing protein [Candidatus Thermoplasmatota archaeon]MDP7264572.1 AbrB/MazE/SpoVT family DNA-binding domain-containing protein [Candidatus Thermoplasmatota archaeon]
MLELKAKIGTRGQVVIPKPIRELFQIHAGEDVFFRVSNGDILVRKGPGMKILNRLLDRIEKKTPEPKEIDWDMEYYSQFED